MNVSKKTRVISGCVLCGCYLTALADGSAIDKIYHPYVQSEEKELEFRALLTNDSNELLDNTSKYRLGYGQSISEYWFAEFYIIGEKSSGNALDLEAVELEAKWQITEQGEYSADWGLLFELEREMSNNIWEFSTALLIEKEWGKWVGVANIYAVYEWGGGIDNEFETALGLQARYRFSRAFEPALEFYAGQDTKGIGPVVMGDIKMQGRKKLHWETGIILGLDDVTADQTIKGILEFEF